MALLMIRWELRAYQMQVSNLQIFGACSHPVAQPMQLMVNPTFTNGAVRSLPIAKERLMLHRIDEIAIKCMILQNWRTSGRIDRNSVIATEYVLGTAKRRADLAILGDQFTGVEIKSEFDSLDRLNGQVATYEGCFDRVVVVAAAKHTAKCIDRLPSHIELWQVDRSGELTQLRPAAVDSEPELSLLLRLLTLEQLRKLVGAGNTRIPRRDLYAAASLLEQGAIRELVTEAFRRTYWRTSESFWRAIGRRTIAVRDLSHLSRFAPDRAAASAARVQEENFWKEWQSAAASTFSNFAEPSAATGSISPSKSLPKVPHHPLAECAYEY
jgi:hypothetical protein